VFRVENRVGRLFVVRHGESVHNFGDVRYSGSTDIPLSADGQLQAQATGRALSRVGLQHIFSSPLERANMTAAAIGEACGVHPEIDEGLREVDFGDWEGQSADLIKCERGSEYLRYETDPIAFPPPGGEHPFAVLGRISPLLFRRIPDILGRGDGPVAVVSHHTVIRLFVGIALRLPIQDYRSVQIGNASITVVDWNPNHGYSVGAQNQQSHLGREEADA
jgi:broad specificity phosphatase PhoE